jgi:E3 ubiquitin-protein ligase BRE1
VRRLQLSLAVRNGNVELADKLKAGLEDKEARRREDEDVEMIEALQDRLKAAQESSADLKRQLDARSSTTTEQDLIGKVASLQKELDQLTAILKSADEGITGDEVKARLVGQVEEIAGLKREVASAQTISNALCDEVDTIQEAYNQSQKVAMERVAEVAKMENKILRLTTEKSKADNKYYEAMRTKESIEREGQVQSRNLDRQTKVIEGYQEVERTFQSHTQQCEAELTQLRSVVAQQNTAMLAMQETLEGAQRRAASAQSAQQEAELTSSRRNTEYVEESRLRQDIQEKYDKSNRELDRCKKQLASSGGSSRKKSVSGGDDVQVEYLQALLRCSACKERYRDRIITRCLHTFCQDCVDARIQTRQRKCPHCGLGFSTSDVQTLFLQ